MTEELVDIRKAPQPDWCPFLIDGFMPDQVKGCKHILTVGRGTAFCIGRTNRIRFNVAGEEHDNSYILCIYSPRLAGHVPCVCAHLINRNDEKSD